MHDVLSTTNLEQSALPRLSKKEGIASSTIVVNVQGDEPFIPAENIKQVADNLANAPQCQMATLSTPIERVEDVFKPQYR